MADVPDDISELYEDHRCLHELEAFEPYKAEIAEILEHLFNVASAFAHKVKEVTLRECPMDDLVGRDYISMVVGIDPEVMFNVIIQADPKQDKFLVNVAHGSPDVDEE